jgi:hypothetical protein
MQPSATPQATRPPPLLAWRRGARRAAAGMASRGPPGRCWHGVAGPAAAAGMASRGPPPLLAWRRGARRAAACNACMPAGPCKHACMPDP